MNISGKKALTQSFCLPLPSFPPSLPSSSSFSLLYIIDCLRKHASPKDSYIQNRTKLRINVLGLPLNAYFTFSYSNQSNLHLVDRACHSTAQLLSLLSFAWVTDYLLLACGIPKSVNPVSMSISLLNPIKIIGIWPCYPFWTTDNQCQTMDLSGPSLRTCPHCHRTLAVKNIQLNIGIMLTLLNFSLYCLHSSLHIYV